MGTVLVYSEDSDLALELVSMAGKLGRDASVAVVGVGDLAGITNKLSVQGVKAIFQASDDSFKDCLCEPVVDALEGVFKQAGPDLVIIGSTKRGKEVAPRLATRLKLGFIPDATEIQLNDKDAVADRLVWGGSAIAHVASKGVAVVTIPPRACERAKGSSSPSVTNVPFKPSPSKVSVVERKEKPKDQVSLKDAEIIVSAGRGFKKKEDLAILDDLTKVLNGVLGASRPLTSDLGWLPEERQVGLTGSTVKPKLYLAVGISGQIQHLTGMRDSKLVAAINSDKNAPIFQESDYGVVGDLYLVVPELVRELGAALGR
jgi:electron transfer flavoprotein alpha subunit